MIKTNQSLCMCCSGKKAALCCVRFLDEGKLAKTPEQLMRSRFSAFALGGYGGYLMKTWFPETAPKTLVAELSHSDRAWHSLQIIKKWQKGDTAMVEFKAYFQSEAGEGKELFIQHEKSRFKRNKGTWYYYEGEVLKEA